MAFFDEQRFEHIIAVLQEIHRYGKIIDPQGFYDLQRSFSSNAKLLEEVQGAAKEFPEQAERFFRTLAAFDSLDNPLIMEQKTLERLKSDKPEVYSVLYAQLVQEVVEIRKKWLASLLSCLQVIIAAPGTPEGFEAFIQNKFQRLLESEKFFLRYVSYTEFFSILQSGVINNVEISESLSDIDFYGAHLMSFKKWSNTLIRPRYQTQWDRASGLAQTYSTFFYSCAKCFVDASSSKYFELKEKGLVNTDSPSQKFLELLAEAMKFGKEYVDDEYRFSFEHALYIFLTGITTTLPSPEDASRIIEQNKLVVETNLNNLKSEVLAQSEFPVTVWSGISDADKAVIFHLFEKLYTNALEPNDVRMFLTVMYQEAQRLYTRQENVVPYEICLYFDYDAFKAFPVGSFRSWRIVDKPVPIASALLGASIMVSGSDYQKKAINGFLELTKDHHENRFVILNQDFKTLWPSKYYS